MDVVTLGAAIAIAGSGGGSGGGDLPAGGTAGDLLEKTANGCKWSGDIPAALALKPDASDIPVSVVTPSSGSTFTLDPCPVTYMFGEKAELTVTVTAASQYHFAFSCPSSAATVLTITGETMRCGDTLAAGKMYEVDIWAGITRICEVDGEAVTP